MVNVYHGGQRGERERSLTESDLETISCSVNPSTGVPNVREIEQLPLAVPNTEHMCKMCFFSQGPLVPPSLSS